MLGIYTIRIIPFENGGFVSVVDSVTHKVLIRDLDNDIIRPFQNGGLGIVVDSVTRKVHHMFQKMTPKLGRIFGYELCIIPKDMQIDLN